MASSEERRKGRRILDYLNDGEELGSIEGPYTVAPRSPSAAARSLLPRFRWARISRLGRKGAAGGGGRGKGKDEEEEEGIAVEKGEHDNLGASACATAATDGNGTRPTDLGVGMSLVFLLAKTSDEFNKMAKVRAEMETLLREFKQQVRNTATDGEDVVSGAARNVESAASSCLTDRNEVANARTSTSSAGMEAAMSLRCCEKSPEDVLEEEFHAELQRLQVNYGCSSVTPSFLPEDHNDTTDYRGGGFSDDEDSGEDVAEDEEAAADADDDGNDYDGAEYNGVSAVELERRLHELLHQRNQERIEELEAALRRAERRLVERETEACLWKDTARLALRQDDDDEEIAELEV